MAAQAPCYPHFTGLLVTSILRQPIRHVVGADTSTINTSGFHDAVEQGDLDQIRAWIEKGASPRLCPTTGRFVSHFDVNIPDKGRAGATALHIASRRGHLDIIQVLSGRARVMDCVWR